MTTGVSTAPCGGLLVTYGAREHGNIDRAAEHVGHAFAGATALDVKTQVRVGLLVLLRPQADHRQQCEGARNADGFSRCCSLWRCAAATRQRRRHQDKHKE
jgi:hypothetical protein